MSKIVITNTELYKELLYLEPEYYYRKTNLDYIAYIESKWKEILKNAGVNFAPVFYHKKKESKNSRNVEHIELEDEDKNVLIIKEEDVVFKIGE